jgi:cytochrome c2
MRALIRPLRGAPALLLAATLLVAPPLLGLDTDQAIAAGPQPSDSSGPRPRVGDPRLGQRLIGDIGCGSCHVVPGVSGADGMVGPPLDHMGRRQIIAGMLRNTQDNMVKWLRFPQQVVPGNAMPDMGLTEDQAKAIAAYLFTLQ